MSTLSKIQKRDRRHARVRSKVSGTAERPRLSVFKSNTRIVAQVIDDVAGTTIAAVSSAKEKGTTAGERAQSAAATIAKAALAKGVTKVVFDRGGFLYTGTIKAFADAARAGGLQF